MVFFFTDSSMECMARMTRWLAFYTPEVFVDFRRPYWWTKTVHRYGASIRSSDKRAWNVSANNSETVGHKDLRLGKLLYITLLQHLIFLASSTGRFLIFFVCRVYCVTVKTNRPCHGFRRHLDEKANAWEITVFVCLLCQWYFFTSFFLLSRMSSSRNSKRSTDPRFSKSTIYSFTSW